MADHDQLFKGLLRTFLPHLLALVAPDLLPEVSLADIHFLDQEVFLDWPSGGRREVDLLARLGLPQEWTLLVHIEIEAAFGTEAELRLKRYFYLLKSRYDEPVLPILVYLRGGPSGVRRQILDEETVCGLRELFTYFSFGLSGCSAEEYLARPEPLAWALAALMRPGPDGRAEQKVACLNRIARAGLNDLQIFVLVNCVETYLNLDPEETARFERLRSLATNEEGRAVEMTWADRMRAEGLQMGLETGRQEGRQEGREEGREEGVRQLLRRQLERRFGELSASALRQLAAVGSLDRLNDLAEQLLTARSLDELGLA